MEMENETSFAEAFDLDLSRSELEQSRVCELLSVDDDVPISTAAISNWKKRDRIPYARLLKLVEIFGPDSECAKYKDWVDTQQPSRLTPARRQNLAVTSMVNLIKTGSPPSDDTEQRLTRLLAVVYQIPEHGRAAALRSATEVLLDHLPPPPRL